MGNILILKKHPLHVFWNAKGDSESFAPEVTWKLTEELQVKVKLVQVLTGFESRVELQR